MGSASIDTKGPLTCGQMTSVNLTYTAGHFGIDDSGSIKISFRTASDQTRFQTENPKGIGYVSVRTSNGAAVTTWYESNRNIRPWHHTLYIQCKRFLAEGDKIIVCFGDQSQGGPGFRVQTFTEKTFEFRVHVDAFATYDYVVLPDEKQPKLEIIAGEAASYSAILPTLRSVNDSFWIGIKAEDRWGNPTALKSIGINLRASRHVIGLPKNIDFAGSGGVIRINDLKVETPGELIIYVEDNMGRILASSNTLVSLVDIDFRHYWSDLHGQSEETVGTNSAKEYFEFARDKALVDIAGHQGNDFQVTDSFWRELNEITASLDHPDRFLALPGYEWSGNTSVGGDHNVWYRQEGRPIFRSHRALVMEDSSAEDDALTLNDLFKRLKKEDAFVVAHVGGRYADVSYAHDAKLEPSVEVHSAWGTFEWIFEEALQAGYRVGIVAGSDDHKGRPGSSYPGASKFGSYGGLTCHLLPELNRDSLFKAFRQRRHYATTGCRAYIDLRLKSLGNAIREEGNDLIEVTEALIGDIIKSDSESVTFDLKVAGHCGIERIEIRDGLNVLEIIKPLNNHRKSGKRFRIQCEGAEYKGRGRMVNWDVQVSFKGPKIKSVKPINFWNPDRKVYNDESNISWSGVTTGGTHAVDVWTENSDSGTIKFSSNIANFELDLSSLLEDDYSFHCGGLKKLVRIFRLTEQSLPSNIEIVKNLEINDKSEKIFYAKIVFEDGHIAWTSPIYISQSKNKGQEL
jgi:hypothetical protein